MNQKCHVTFYIKNSFKNYPHYFQQISRTCQLIITNDCNWKHNLTVLRKIYLNNIQVLLPEYHVQEEEIWACGTCRNQLISCKEPRTEINVPPKVGKTELVFPQLMLEWSDTVVYNKDTIFKSIKNPKRRSIGNRKKQWRKGVQR